MVSELLSRYSEMPIQEISDSTEIYPDHIYLMPPRKNMMIASDVGRHPKRPVRTSRTGLHLLSVYLRALYRGNGFPFAWRLPVASSCELLYQVTLISCESGAGFL